jgi:hypothetical protein
LRLRGCRTGGGESCDRDHGAAGHWHWRLFPGEVACGPAIRNNGKEANPDRRGARR